MSAAAVAHSRFCLSHPQLSVSILGKRNRPCAGQFNESTLSDARPLSDLLPPDGAYWARLTLRDRANLAGVGAAIVVGLVADQCLRTGSVGLGFSLAIGLGGLALVWIGVQRLEPQLYATVAVVFGAWLTVCASPWLLWPDLIALLLLLGMAASLSVRGTMLDLGLAESVARAAHGLLHLSAGTAFILRPIVQLRPRVGRILPVVRGLLIATPLAVLVAALLASADPIFASFVSFNLDFGQLALDALYVLLVALVMAGLLRIAAAEPLEQVDGPVRRLGAVEGLVVLAVLDAVFAGFAVAQAIGASGAGRRNASSCRCHLRRLRPLRLLPAALGRRHNPGRPPPLLAHHRLHWPEKPGSPSSSSVSSPPRSPY